VYRNFGVISCFVGTGKTWALKHYIVEHPNAVLIEATPDMNALVMMREIVEATGAVVTKSNKWSRGTKSDLMDAVIRKLKGTDTLLIIDEAEKVTTQTLEYVRRISDLANIGVVLCGTEYLKPLIRDPRGRFGQISSRVGFWPPVIKAITYTDACKIVDAALGEHIEISDELHKAFYKVSDGSARVLARTLIPAVHDYGIRKGKDITPRLIFTIGEQLLGYHVPGTGVV
jgi:DNA transposition AAA+ family ATPase